MTAFAHSDLRSSQLRKLTEVSRALTYTVSLDDVLQLTVHRAAELLNSQQSVLMLSDSDGLLSVRASFGIDQERCDAFREPMHETIGARLQGLLGGEHANSSFTAVPLVVSGQVTGLLAVAHAQDPSDDEQEWLLSALADQAAIALEKTRLDETGAFRERLMGIVGHDLRTPLQAVTMAAALLLRDETLGERQRFLAQRVAYSATRMTDIIGQLLDFTRSRLGGGMPLTRVGTELTAVCRRVIDELELVHPGRAIVLDSRTSLSGDWDPDRLSQALSNVIGNALQHGSESMPVEVTVTSQGGDGLIRIHNDGPPIPAELIPHLFDPFRRGPADLTDVNPSEGLGLGLFIAQQIVQAHGGAISIASSDAEGTTVSIQLPVTS